MKTFKNMIAQKSSTVSTVQFVKAEEAPKDFGEWVEVDDVEIDFAGAIMLYRQAGVEFYGQL